MTTVEEPIYLMAWLRNQGEFGQACMTKDSEYEDLPEYCRGEN